jgi:hypothetical protein
MAARAEPARARQPRLPRGEAASRRSGQLSRRARPLLVT